MPLGRFDFDVLSGQLATLYPELINMLVFVGDIHGEFVELIEKLAGTGIEKSSCIQVGDFGLGFKSQETESAELENINTVLAASENMLYVIRGNHDNPNYFNNTSNYSNIQFLPDYSLLTIEGLTILLVGGAISIDRKVRVLNQNYWENEGFNYNYSLLEKAIEGFDHIDIVVTHEAPTEFHPTELGKLVVSYWIRDRELINDVKKERAKLSLLLNSLIGKKLKPKFWYYGHYHTSFLDSFEGIKYRIMAINEFFEHRT